MKLRDAHDNLHEIMGKPYSYIHAWGIHIAKESIRTILDRKSSTVEDRELAESIRYKIFIGDGFNHK